MAEIRQKPKMDAPKTKSAAAHLPKEAGRMLLEEYREAAREKSERAGRPEQEAAEKVERGAHTLGRQGLATTRRVAHQLSPFSKTDNLQQSAQSTEAGPFSVKNRAQAVDGRPTANNALTSKETAKARREAVRVSLAKAKFEAERPDFGTCDAVPDSHRLYTADWPKSGALRPSTASPVTPAGEASMRGQTSLSSRLSAASRPAGRGSLGLPSGIRTTPAAQGQAKAGAFKTRAHSHSILKSRQQAGAAVKTKRQAMAQAKKTAKAAKQARRHAKTAATTTQKATAATTKLARRVTMAIVRAATAIAKPILAAAGPVVVVLLVFLAIAAILVFLASPFGVFYAGEDEAAKTQMQETMGTLAAEYHTKIRTIIEENPHDEMRLNFNNQGHLRQDNLVDILAVYALQTANLQGGEEVISLHPEVLAEVFWAMQELRFEVKNEPKYTERQVYNEETEEYEAVGEWKDHRVLIIEATCKGAGEMADGFAFSADQRDILDEMLSGPYDSYFENMIGDASLFLALGDGGSVVGSGNFIWPSPASTYVSSPYGHRPGVGVGDFHLGIDIAAGTGTPVLAADGGTVISNSVHYSYGTHLLIDHGNGTQTLYAHMSAAHVGVGDSVTQGQTIGLVGNTGVSFGAHLHFEVKVNGSTVNPLQFFSNYTVG